MRDCGERESLRRGEWVESLRFDFCPELTTLSKFECAKSFTETGYFAFYESIRAAK